MSAPDDKITTKIASLPPSQPFFSLEFFPPKTAPGRENLHARLARMARGLRPLFVTVTWGAGGSTAQKSLALAEVCRRQLGLTTCLHLTCTNMSRAVLDEALAQAREIGVRNILALRGDPPRNDEYKEEDEEGEVGRGANGPAGEEREEEEEDVAFVYAIDLVRYIRKHHDEYFCIGVAAYPEGHVDGSITTTPGDGTQDPARDLPYLVEKVKAGADFILTQLFYTVDAYLSFERRLREHESGVFASIPIIPGLMPIQSYQTLRRTAKLSNAMVPKHVYDQLEPIKGDDEAVKTAGVDILVDIVERIKSEPPVVRGAGGVDTIGLATRRGFHFYTLNLEKAVAFVLERSDLIPPDDSSDRPDGESEEVAIVVEGPNTAPGTTITINRAPHTEGRTRRASSIDPHNSVIVEDIRSELLQARSRDPANSLSPAKIKPAVSPTPNPPTIAISEGEGSLGRAATWDDFPNGRFGDSRSPAFGEIDGYGPSLPLPPQQAITHWGYPTSTSDITSIFLKCVDGQIPAVAWSASAEGSGGNAPGGGGLSAESNRIKHWLREMNARGWWTIASQPAVNAGKSDNSEVGWGPKGGWVWQKAFVEFWMPRGEWAGLRERLEREGSGEVSWYMGDCNSTVHSNHPENAVNAVTWGCFPGKEILTPTIIEHASFRAWLDEAFALWDQWAALYPRRSATAKFLRELVRGRGAGGGREGGEGEGGYVLVNVIHHGYVDEEGLWRCLGLKGGK
ncbi:methylenetetrahydrofolate reductase-domain-containing protein [Tirmania nivea]|nr:methylenetetrahydrofolate reductase-domain-containing protein [Tirmania nivea]